jgi:1,4-alpha-glucan branching enzyme
LIAPLRELEKAGALELMACTASHALMPLVSRPEAQRAQLAVAIQCHRRHFGQPPAGLWLPECGYQPGLDELIREAGFSYFLVDSHGLLFGDPFPEFALYAPVRSPAGPAVFSRDLDSSWQVWNLHNGYPGDPYYREFYRDLGHDAEFEYIRPYLHPDGVRRNVGIKYHRITGNASLGQREPYDPPRALERVADHARHFVSQRETQAGQVQTQLGVAPLFLSPYDAELFGHWWYEGPLFLEQLFRELSRGQGGIRPVTLSEFLDSHPPRQEMQPAASTWGADGYHQVWLNPDNQWIYRHQHWAENRMVELANQFLAPPPEIELLLNQAARELLLAQSSDWAFLITHQKSLSYAVQRFRTHIDRFQRIEEGLRQGSLDSPWFQEISNQDNLFPDIDYRVFATRA